ncbi:uncharacterized protein LOC110845437 [Folsomia candida]|uniref:Uncharacterized protein n=1 Tax=Folsomia candida TaxID=158441 RepID=A0A226ENN8_FOLCA|nr:uncharacterized protein LOC110845437 [Folsomia candida]OXA58196.1 hypothetical protein Fcan01_08126 [Folsomia candida]
MDKFVIRLNATPSTSTTTACTSSTVIDSPPPSPAEQPPVKKAKPYAKVIPPQRETSVDWRSRVILSDDNEVGFLNSQEEFENLFSEGPPTPSSSAILPIPNRFTKSPLFTVRVTIFNHLQEKYPLIEFTLETVESTAEYKNLMQLWNKHFKKFEKSDPWKAASPPGVTFLHDNQPVGVKYVDGRLFYKVKKEGVKFVWNTSVGSKCRVENCSEKTNLDGHCYSHNIVKREILMIRDVANLDKMNLTLVQPNLKKGKFTDLGLNLCLRGPHYDCRAIGQYLAKFPTAWFVIEKRWEYLNEESVRKFQSLGILMSIMVSFHNSVAAKPSEQIKFINCEIYTKSADLDDVNKTLALNNMGFEIRDDNNSLKFENSPFVPTNFNRKLPYVYVGDNKQGGYRFGEDRSETCRSVVKGSYSHQSAKSTTMAGIDPENRHNVFQADPPRLQQKRV